jgi:hypothetical protein
MSVSRGTSPEGKGRQGEDVGCSDVMGLFEGFTALFTLQQLLLVGGLLNSYGFCQVSRLVHVAAASHGYMVGQQLQWHDRKHGREKFI